MLSSCLECIVALCPLHKTREDGIANEMLLKLLSPATNDDVKQIVERLVELKKNSPKIKTFLSFEIHRPSTDKTHELLYAAHGYLSGTIDSNAIHVLDADFGDAE